MKSLWNPIKSPLKSRWNHHEITFKPPSNPRNPGSPPAWQPRNWAARAKPWRTVGWFVRCVCGCSMLKMLFFDDFMMIYDDFMMMFDDLWSRVLDAMEIFTEMLLRFLGSCVNGILWRDSLTGIWWVDSLVQIHKGEMPWSDDLWSTIWSSNGVMIPVGRSAWCLLGETLADRWDIRHHLVALKRHESTRIAVNFYTQLLQAMSDCLFLSKLASSCMFSKPGWT